MNTIRLRDYPDTPLYNIKAVVQATGITSSTLRAWERRYDVTHPKRSDSGYRLYSDRDIILIRWLKSQVDAGMAISQAVAWLEGLIAEADSVEYVHLPESAETAAERMTPITQHLATRDFSSLCADLLHALLQLNEAEAELVLAEAFSLYPMEMIGEKVIAPVLISVGEKWHEGIISVADEHFATAYLQQRLAAILRTVPITGGDSLIWIACAPKEEHEIGAMLLTIYLRRAGYRVQYFGKNLPISDFKTHVQRHRPTMVLLSAAMDEAARELANLAEELSNLSDYHPIIGYGGQAFQRRPDLRNRIPGIYMGDTALEAIESTNELLGGGNLF
jgi:methanogenic corrinoid protein MtbC1